MKKTLTPTLLCLGLLTACTPLEEDQPSRITDTRILAIKATPAEARPGQSVRFTALIADPQGPIDAGQRLNWALCLAPKPPTENNSVVDDCLGDEAVTALGQGTEIEAVLPAQGCQLFGPLSPGPGLRPRDADITGGYYQPMRLSVEDTVGFGLERLRCDLAQAPLQIAQAFEGTYQDNLNPSIESLDAPEALSASQTVTLTLTTDAPEPYVRFDAITRALVEDQEALTVSWFATGGQLQASRSSVRDQQVQVQWTAPGQAGEHWLFGVLRDSRGGVDFVQHKISVTP